MPPKIDDNIKPDKRIAFLYVRTPEPCDFFDSDGHRIDISHTEFYGKKRVRKLDTETGKIKTFDVEANPEKLFKVPNSPFWLQKILRGLLIQTSDSADIEKFEAGLEPKTKKKGGKADEEK